MNLPPTGSLVEWRRGPRENLGMVVSYEEKNTPIIPSVVGAWVHWPDQDHLMWSAISSLSFLVQTGSSP